MGDKWKFCLEKHHFQMRNVQKVERQTWDPENGRSTRRKNTRCTTIHILWAEYVFSFYN